MEHVPAARLIKADANLGRIPTDTKGLFTLNFSKVSLKIKIQVIVWEFMKSQ